MCALVCARPSFYALEILGSQRSVHTHLRMQTHTPMPISSFHSSPRRLVPTKVKPYGKSISLSKAKGLAHICSQEALANGWAMAIAVVDTGGHLIYFEREEGTQIASLQMAIDKAKCSVGFKKPTKDFEDRIANGTLRILGMDSVVPVEGGMPLEMNGEIVGAIGISGGSAKEDGIVAAAGVQALPTI